MTRGRVSVGSGGWLGRGEAPCTHEESHPESVVPIDISMSYVNSVTKSWSTTYSISPFRGEPCPFRPFQTPQEFQPCVFTLENQGFHIRNPLISIGNSEQTSPSNFPHFTPLGVFCVDLQFAENFFPMDLG
jgi:hypothetical protein